MTEEPRGMTLEEAIEINRALKPALSYDSYQDAIQLGIEALKRLGEMRRSRIHLPGWLLPGEAKE